MDCLMLQELEMVGFYSTNNFSGLKIPAQEQLVLSMRCEALIDLITQYASQYNLSIARCRVTSNFYNGLSTINGLNIGLIDYQYIIEKELYKKLANIAQKTKTNGALKICLGYGKRSIDLKNNAASITTGSHSALENLVYLDIVVHRLTGKEAMKARFAHEMLHEFGRTEGEVLVEENNYYEKIKDIVDPLLQNIYSALPEAEKSLFDRIERMITEKNLAKELEAVCNTLHSFGAIPLGSTVKLVSSINAKEFTISVY